MLTPTIPPATRTNAYIIMTERGCWVWDPGSPHPKELQRLIDAVDELAGGRASVRGYVISHHHRDHWGGIEHLLTLVPAPVVAKDPARIKLDAEFLTPADLAAELEGFCVEPAPGHTKDHIVVLTPERDLIAGDVIAGEGTVVIDPPDGHIASYMATLAKLQAMQPRRIFPAHGSTVEDGIAKLIEYREHRQEREAQVVHWLLELAPAAPADLVPQIYGDVPLFLHPVAARSVLAHLIKLKEDGNAMERHGKWSMIG